jgi:hypothetical protein
MPTTADTPFRFLRFDELSTRQNQADAVAKQQLAARKTSGDGTSLGVFLPMIGVSNNTVTTGTLWTAEPPAPPAAGNDVARVKTRSFEMLTRGQKPCDAYAPGIFTHRWFVVRPENVQRMTDSSVEAWKSSEEDTEMRVVGFWLDRESGPNGEATILMIVYYPDLAAWDASRYWKPLPKGQDQPHRHLWGELFRQRREITLDSWVSVHRLAG